MPRVSQQYLDARRDHILDAARRCFLRDGFHATSMQDLFAEAGLSSGAVYRYFTSKDELIIAIAAQNMGDVMTMIHTAAAAQPSRSVGAVLADALALVQAKHEQEGLGGLAVLAWAEAMRNPSLAARFTESIMQMRADLADLLRARRTSGDLQGDLPADLPGEVTADALAAVLISIVPGFIVQLALLGPSAVAGAPEVVSALWPADDRRVTDPESITSAARAARR